ncbi:MAG: ribonuclease P protein component [Patescibacteria group bacterium]|nr:ribonuclease P protein component [Patescibacteria group bacterium]
MIKKRDRLTAKDIQALSLGKSVFGTLVSFRYVGAEKTKIAAAVAKKGAPRAVDRNRIRRRVYAAAVKPLSRVSVPFHGMIMAKKEAATAPFDRLVSDIETVFSRAGLFGR